MFHCVYLTCVIHVWWYLRWVHVQVLVRRPHDGTVGRLVRHVQKQRLGGVVTLYQGLRSPDNSTVQYSTVQYSTSTYSSVQFSTVQYSTP